MKIRGSVIEKARVILRRLFFPLVVVVASLVVLAAVVTGCSSGSSSATTVGESTTGVSSSATTGGSETTTTTPQLLSEYDKELAKTAQVQHELAVFLQDQQAAQDDPRMAVVYGLRARTVALTCRKALSTGDLTLADTAMKNVYTMVNMAVSLAKGADVQTLAGAKEVVATLGAPSGNPDEAAKLLDQFIAQLAPLMDEAAALDKATTST